MIGIFKHKNPVNLLLLLVFGILIKLPMFLQPHQPVNLHTEGVIYRLLLNAIKPFGTSYPIIYPVIAFTLLYLQAIALTRLFNDQRMMNKATYLVGVSYLLITSLFAEWNYLSAPLLVNTVLIMVFAVIFKMYQHQHVQGKIFNAGLLIGLVSFIYFPATAFLFWVFLGLIIMRPFRLTEWLLAILGLLTPFYFYGIFLFFIDQWDLQKLIPFFNLNAPVLDKTLWFAYAVFLIGIPFFIAVYYVQANLGRMLIQVRKNWSLVLLFLILAIFIPFINGSETYENWIMLTIPLAAFHTFAYLYPTQTWFSQIMFWFTIVYVLAFQYYGPGW